MMYYVLHNVSTIPEIYNVTYIVLYNVFIYHIYIIESITLFIVTLSFLLSLTHVTYINEYTHTLTHTYTHSYIHINDFLITLQNIFSYMNNSYVHKNTGK